jgi:CBS domain-containing protein
MNRHVTAATPGSIGRNIALQLLSGNYSGMPVVDAVHTVIGVETEFDLLKAVREGIDLGATTAEDIMERRPICIEEDDPIETVVEKMTTHGVVRVPAVQSGKLVGVVSRVDLLRCLVEPEFVTVLSRE